MRSEFLDFTKGILIILVVIGHTIQFPLLMGDLCVFNDPLYEWIYMFHMPMFIVISGYLSRRTILNYDAITIFKAKTINYLLPILSWSLLSFFADCLLDGGFSLNKITDALIPKFFSSLWYLWVLFMCVILTKFLVSFRLPNKLLVIATIIMLPECWHFPLLKFLLPFFLLGYFFSSPNNTLLKRLNLNIIGCFLIAITAFLINYLCSKTWNYDTYIYTTGMVPDLSNLYNISLRYIISIILVFVNLILFYKLFRINPEMISNATSLLGRYSLHIYVIHTPLILAMMKFISSGNLKFSGTMFYASAIFIAVSILLLSIFLAKISSFHNYTRFFLYGINKVK
jgi:fucose 4-O-acetylase-like acetyltransferase